jgi:cytochrome c
MKKIILLIIALIVTGCNDNNQNDSKIHTQNIHLDGKALLESKCSKCHNLDFPPTNFENEVAPPMMTISFHFDDWFKASTANEKLLKQLDFITDYIINPTVEKSYCDKHMLDKYGLMPSQKGNVTEDEIQAIGKYIFSNYTTKRLSAKQEALARLHSLPMGEQLNIKYKCTGCHKINMHVVGPSFKEISQKYKSDTKTISNSIKNGSQNKWENSHGLLMPSFKSIPANDLEIISKWIISLKGK